VGFTQEMVVLDKLEQVFVDGTFQSTSKLLQFLQYPHYTNYLVYQQLNQLKQNFEPQILLLSGHLKPVLRLAAPLIYKELESHKALV